MARNDRFTFYFAGMVEGAYAFRAPTYHTSRRDSRAAQSFEADLTNWLLDEMPPTAVQPRRWHLGNGSAPGYPALPFVYRTGASLGLLLYRLTDVVFFEQNFRVVGLPAIPALAP